MKRNILILFGLVLAFSSCQNELYNDPQSDWTSKQALYLSGNTVTQTFVEAGKDIDILAAQVSLVKKTDQKITANIVTGTQEDLDAYNAANGTNYLLLPSNMYSLPKQVDLPANITNAKVYVHLHNLEFSLKGTYALPIKLTSSNLPVSPGEDFSLVVLEQKTVTKALKINGSGTEDDKMFPSDFKVPQWTMEVMLNRSAYNANNKSIAGTKLLKGSSANDEIYPRFGDVTIEPNQLQIKTGSSQIDVPKDKFAAKPNEWYMISFVYDGHKNYVYVNGALVAEREIRTGPYGLIGFWIGGANELIREVRFYKVARTPQQIKDYLWKMVDPTDKDLLLYYPMNGKKRDAKTGEITNDETKVWDWASGGHHLNMPSGAVWSDNNGKMFTFPLEK